MKQNGQARAGLGAASMVLILLVLCLALLGVLSLMTARNDLSISERDVQLAQAYAQAASQAQRSLMELDMQLSAAWQSSKDEAQYVEACMNFTQAGCASILWTDARTASMAFDAGQDREIALEIQCSSWAEAAEKRFEVIRHTLEDTYEWEQTEGLVLMGL